MDFIQTVASRDTQVTRLGISGKSQQTPTNASPRGFHFFTRSRHAARRAPLLPRRPPRHHAMSDTSGSGATHAEEDATSALGPYLGRLPTDVLRNDLLPRLGETDVALFSRVSRACKAAVVSAGPPRSMKLRVSGFVGSVEMLAWAWVNGCPWNDVRVCELVAEGGHLEVLKFARAVGCPWNECTCAWAAGGGHLDVLRWARANGCEWDTRTCAWAAANGHLDVLQWARENGCPEPF